jgi:hypothetical protein
MNVSLILDGVYLDNDLTVLSCLYNPALHDLIKSPVLFQVVEVVAGGISPENLNDIKARMTQRLLDNLENRFFDAVRRFFPDDIGPCQCLNRLRSGSLVVGPQLNFHEVGGMLIGVADIVLTDVAIVMLMRLRSTEALEESADTDR